jgi:glutathionyl-hydroquinone reductase
VEKQQSPCPYLAGDALTLADIAYLPFIDRFSVACNHFKGYDFLRGENHWRFIRRWMHHMCEMDEFTSTRLNDEEIIQLVDQQLNENYFERFGLTRKAPPARPERRGFRLQPSDSYAAIMDTLKGES